jgi:hypothetical protein
MPAGATLGAAALGLGGAYLSGEAAKKAAGIQAGAAREGQANALTMYNQGRQDLAPYRDAGAGATTTLAQLYGIPTPGNPNPQPFGPEATAAFRNSPDYQFAFDEGNRAVQFSAAARGALGSGNTLRDLTTFGQGAATQNFQNYANRLMQLAQMGQGAASQGASQANQFGQFAANQIGNAGQAQASGIVGQSNAWNQGLSSAGNNLMLYNLMNQQNNPSAYGGSMSGYDPSWNTMAMAA